MAPPSALRIATQSVLRLVKEEAYYHDELATQQARVKKLEGDIQGGNAGEDQNAEYVLKQEVRRYSLLDFLFQFSHNASLSFPPNLVPSNPLPNAQ